MQKFQRKLEEQEVRGLLRMHVKSWINITAKDLLKATLVYNWYA